MRNRAKCKKCQSVIESFHSTDLVYCKCGEIFVDGGEALKCGAGDFDNFLRVDDRGNEIMVKVVTDTDRFEEKPLSKKPDREELIRMLENMISSYETLPHGGLDSYCTNYDLCACMLIMLAIFKSETKNE